MRALTKSILACLVGVGFLGLWGTASAQVTYCLPTYNSQCTSGDLINDVNFVTINNTGTGCSNPGTSNYTDYSATISTTVAQGATYPISVAPGPQWEQYFVAFADWNQDGDFDDPGEFYDIGFAPAGTTISNLIAVPITATLGTTRFRVMCRYFSTPLTQADVCTTGLSFGEVEDYGLIVIPPPPVDISSIGVEDPVTRCVLDTEMVTGVFLNQGLNDTSGITLCYQVNNGTPVCEVYNDTLASGDTLFYTFMTPAVFSAAGVYSIDVFNSIGNDAVSTNDTFRGYTAQNYGTPPINLIPYAEDFESGQGNWTVYGDSVSWALGAPSNTNISSAASPSNAFVTNLTGNYNQDELSFLQSPCFDFSGAVDPPFLVFSQNLAMDDFDNHFVEVSTDAGLTWSKVGAAGTGVNWYNDTFDDSWNGDGDPLGSWRTAYNSLGSIVLGNDNVFFRFVMEETGFTQEEGVGIDDVRVVDTVLNLATVSALAPINGCGLSSTETVTAQIFNLGSVAVSNYDVCFIVNNGTPVCENVSASLDPDSTLTYTFTNTADLSAVNAYDIKIYTSLPGDTLFDNDTTFSTVTNFPLVTTFPYIADFEGNQDFWASGGTNSSWEWGTPAKLNIVGAANGTGAWVNGTLGFFNYNPNEDSYVESPCFDLSGLANPWVGANVWWHSEFSWDGMVVEYSLDTGQTWNVVGNFNDPFNWYNDNSVNGLGGGDGWCGTPGNNGSEGYVPVKHDVLPVAGNPLVKFRMHFGSDGSVQFDGIAFDDFIIAEPVPVDLGPDLVVCDPPTIAPNLPANGQFSWDSLSSGFTVFYDSSASITPPNGGTFVLTYTDSLGLCDSDTITITQSPVPTVDLGNDQNICTGDSVTLSVDPATYPNVVWSTGDSTSSIMVSAAATYFIDALDSNGCPSTDTVVTSVVPLPTFSFGPDSAVCSGDTFCLSPGITGPGITYLWSTGATTATICSPIVSGYWAIVTDSNGCSFADSIIITTAAPAPTSGASFDTTNCPIVDFTDLSSGSVTDYLWEFGDGNTSTQQNPMYSYAASGNGTYTVLAVVSNSCGKDTTTLTVDINCLVGVESAFSDVVKVYPNPNQGRFRIEADLTGTVPVQVEITDLQGKIIYRKDFGVRSGRFEEPFEIDQPSGIYLIRLQTDGQTAVKKFVIE